MRLNNVNPWVKSVGAFALPSIFFLLLMTRYPFDPKLNSIPSIFLGAMTTASVGLWFTYAGFVWVEQFKKVGMTSGPQFFLRLVVSFLWGSLILNLILWIFRLDPTVNGSVIKVWMFLWVIGEAILLVTNNKGLLNHGNRLETRTPLPAEYLEAVQRGGAHIDDTGEDE